MMEHYIEFITWDFEDMVEQYGMEYMSESDFDHEPFPMDEFNEFETDPFEAVMHAAYGSDYDGGPFSTSRDWFAYDGYGNLLSIDNVHEYLMDIIDEKDFKKWCHDKDYFEDFEGIF